MAMSTANTTDDNVAFVRSIELPEPRYRLPSNNASTVPQDMKKESYVVAGGLTAFTKNVTGQTKQDILNATLLAQLASDKKYNREREIANWYECYIEVLEQVGFAIQDFKFVSYNTTAKTVKLDEVVIAILSKIANEEESEVIRAILNTMQELSKHDEKIILFDRHGSYSSFGNFQVCSCDQARDGVVSLSLGAFYFKSNQKDDNFIFFPWDTMDTKITCGAQKLVLNSVIYAKVRYAVSAKLGDIAKDLVASIDILTS